MKNQEELIEQIKNAKNIDELNSLFAKLREYTKVPTEIKRDWLKIYNYKIQEFLKSK